jgi:hypothetical protein
MPIVRSIRLYTSDAKLTSVHKTTHRLLRTSVTTPVGYKTYTSAQDYTPTPQVLSHNISRIQNLHQCTRLHTDSSEPQPQHQSDTKLTPVHKITHRLLRTSATTPVGYKTYTQCTRLHTDSSEPQPQHLMPNTTCSGIIRIQPNTPEDGHIDARNM